MNANSKDQLARIVIAFQSLTRDRVPRPSKETIVLNIPSADSEGTTEKVKLRRKSPPKSPADLPLWATKGG